MNQSQATKTTYHPRTAHGTICSLPGLTKVSFLLRTHEEHGGRSALGGNGKDSCREDDTPFQRKQQAAKIAVSYDRVCVCVSVGWLVGLVVSSSGDCAEPVLF